MLTTTIEPSTPPADRFNRQNDLVHRRQLLKVPCTVVGVGAVGRQVACMLAAIGAPRIKIIDFDTVELTNLTTQGYSHQDLGKPKVVALYEELTAKHPDVSVTPINEEFRGRHVGGGAFFCGVDKISTRAKIWESVNREVKFWGDTRMQGETIRTLTARLDDPLSYLAYEKTLFTQEEAEPGRCTASSTIYTASIAAGMLVHQFVRWLRGDETDNGQLLFLPNSTLDLI